MLWKQNIVSRAWANIKHCQEYKYMSNTEMNVYGAILEGFDLKSRQKRTELHVDVNWKAAERTACIKHE